MRDEDDISMANDSFDIDDDIPLQDLLEKTCVGPSLRTRKGKRKTKKTAKWIKESQMHPLHLRWKNISMVKKEQAASKHIF